MVTSANIRAERRASSPSGHSNQPPQGVEPDAGRLGCRTGQEEVMSVNLQPLEDRIVVKPGEGEETTASGIVIPDTAKEKPQEGEVVAVGPGRFEDGNRVPLDVKVGDTVIYSKYGGTEVKVGGDEYLILSARDVLAIVGK